MIRIVEPIQEATSEPLVTITVEPDPDRTCEFLRQLLADARAWDAERRNRAAA
jgi:hypothetical protein